MSSARSSAIDGVPQGRRNGESSRRDRGDRLRLCAFLSLAGYVEGAWRLPESDPYCNTDIEYFCALAKTAEMGGMDAVFIADGLALWADVRRRPTGTFEPSIMAAAILRATRRIGVIITLSTTFNEPYNVARRLASLDLASGGRIGWNIVTTSSADAARNFGLERLPSHAERYARCAEFVDVCLKLWTSWTPDAIRGDKAGDWARTDAVRPINHVGSHFRVAGPLDVPRSPQVIPLLVQAGASPEGMGVAAAFADVVFTVQDDLCKSQRHRAALMHRCGRRARTQPIAVLPGLMPIIADSEDEALRAQVHVESLMRIDLAVNALEARFGLDPGSLDPDERFEIELPELSSEDGNQSLYRVLRGMVESGATVGEVARTMNAGRGHLTVVGTAESVADTMIAWFEAEAADGFNVIFPTLPGSMTRFVREVIPILRERGYRDVEAPSAAPSSLRAVFGANLPDVAAPGYLTK